MALVLPQEKKVLIWAVVLAVVFWLIAGDSCSRRKADTQPRIEPQVAEQQRFFRNACIGARTIVRQTLKSPTSAKFPACDPSNYTVSPLQPDGLVVVRGYVDAQNTFGAMLRSPFVVSMKYSGPTDGSGQYALNDILMD